MTVGAFQQDAFQNDAFQAYEVPSVISPTYIIVGQLAQVTGSIPQILQPPIDAVVEYAYVVFDWGAILQNGVTIDSIEEVLCEVFEGVDDDASMRLIYPPFIFKSPTSCIDSTAVVQMVGNMVGGVVYRLQCIVMMTDGQQLSLWAHLECDTPT